MILDKELYEDVIKTINLLFDRGVIGYYTGAAIIGKARWVNVHDWLQEHRSDAFVYSNMEYTAYQKDRLLALRHDCEKEISRLDKEESDRNIDTKYKIKGIIYGRISLIISALAFILSLLTALRQAGIF